MTSGKHGSNPPKSFTCQHCGQPFSRRVKPSDPNQNREFCSPACRNKARQLVPVPCPICGNLFKPYKAPGEKAGVQVYCSRICADKAMVGRLSTNPKAYLSRSANPRWRGCNWQRQKRAALQRDGRKCQICRRKKRKGLRIDVHHIRPFREFDGDYVSANQLLNLITLCRSCHAKVEFGHLACPRPLI